MKFGERPGYFMRFKLLVFKLAACAAITIAFPSATLSETAAPTAISYNYEELVNLFDYNFSLALDIRENSVSEKDGATVSVCSRRCLRQ